MIKAKKKPKKKAARKPKQPKRLAWSSKFKRRESGLAKYREFTSRCGRYSIEEVRSKVLLDAKGKAGVYWQCFCRNSSGWVVRIPGEPATMAAAKRQCLDHYQKP